MNLGPLSEDDVDAALALSTAEGWNQTEADWKRLIRLEPSGCWAAREEGRLIGTVTTAIHARSVAWIGMMIVDRDHRRRGVGAALMERAMSHAREIGVATIKLDATPAGRPLYESLGFIAEVDLERWQGVVVSTAGVESRALPAESWDELHVLDRRAFGADRSRLVETLMAEGAGEPMVVSDEDGQGYALARAGRTATYLGPVIATTAVVADELLGSMLARFTGTIVCLDRLATGFMESDGLARRELTKLRDLTRMFRGARSDVGTGPWICASAGPECG